MIYKIYDLDALTLLDRPETGMGYQIVNAIQYNKTEVRKFVVYNTNLAVDLDSNFQINRRKIINEGYKSVLNNASTLMLETKSINVLGQISIREVLSLSDFKKSYNKRHSGGKGATDSVKEYATGTDYFVRISAYEDDKRIDFEKMSLKSGSFTTTLVDYNDCVSTKDDPIDRYALPNDESIKWSFYIKPKAIDILQRGIVQPAFGHYGGGIEVYFDKGTSANTYLFKREYGK